MKHTLLTLLFLSACNLLPEAQPIPETSSYVNKTGSVMAAVVALVSATEDAQYGFPYCAGVIHESGLILTANHCIESYRKEQGPAALPQVVYFDSITTVRGSTAVTLMYANPDMDLAILRPRDIQFSDGLPLMTGHPTWGDEAISIGHPGGSVFFVSKGIVSHPHRAGSKGHLLTQTDTTAALGSSGGPLLTPRGHIMGIATSIPQIQNEGMHSMPYFIHVGTLREVLDKMLR